MKRARPPALTEEASDDALVLAAPNDPAAITQLILRHQERAWRIAVQFLGDEAEARDIVQKTFLKILAVAENYEAKGRFEAYLHKIVCRLCLDHRKKRRPLPTGDEVDLVDDVDSLATRMDGKERAARVRAALDELPERQRLAVLLHYYAGCGYEEIAKALGATEKAVERLLARARESLARLLAGAAPR